MEQNPYLEVAIVHPDNLLGYAGDAYWLRMKQEIDDDKATIGEIAEVVDTLYDINPCEPVEEKTYEEVRDKRQQVETKTLKEFADLVASKMDIFECARRSSGDYTARLRIVRSHIDEDYTLKLSVGVVSGIARVNEEITLTINVNEQSSVDLDYPVPQQLINGKLVPEIWPGKAKWLGSVFTKKDGPIPSPRISGLQNSLSWGVACTGTIITTFRTFYDIATVEIPGIPGENGATVGSSQNSVARAFYRFQVYEQEIKLIVDDSTANQTLLGTVCGWDGFDGGGGWGGGDDNDEDDDDGADGAGTGPALGCLQYNSNLADPKFYLQTCCKNPADRLPDCAQYATAKAPQSVSDETKRRYIDKSKGGKVSFVVIGPGPEGCGRLITSINIRPKRCCDGVVPLAAYPGNPTGITPGSSALMRVIDGKDGVLFFWKAGGGLKFANNRSEMWGDHNALVYAPDEGFCASAMIQVEDGCSRISMKLQNDEPPAKLEISGQDLIVAPSGMLYVTASGGVPPYQWAGGGDLSLISSADQAATFQASASFCGRAEIKVSDACTEMDTAGVRSTAGSWQWFSENHGFMCSVPMDGTAINNELIADGYKASLQMVAGSGCETSAGNELCPSGNLIADGAGTDTPHTWCVGESECDGNPGWWCYTWDGSCCSECYFFEGGTKTCYPSNGYAQVASNVMEWKC